MWACGTCGVGTEQPDRHREWHGDAPIVLHAATATDGKRCTLCQTLVLHADTHAGWHMARGEPRPSYAA